MGVTAGANASSVTTATSVAFLNAQRSGSQIYVSVLTSSNPAAIFGIAFAAVTVDAASIRISYVSPAGELTLTVCNAYYYYGVTLLA